MNTIDWRNAPPELYNLWRVAKSLIAYSTITPLNFIGTIAASEFNTYSANKVYICLSAKFNYGGINAGIASISVCDMGNVARSTLSNISPAWDTTAVAMKYFANTILIENIWFSRVTASIYTEMIFNGYRLDV